MSSTQEIIQYFVGQRIGQRTARTYADRISRLASTIDSGQVEVNAALAQANREAGAGLSQSALDELATEIESSESISPFEDAPQPMVDMSEGEQSESLLLSDAQADAILTIAEGAGFDRLAAFEALVDAGLMAEPEPEPEPEPEDEDGDGDEVTLDAVMKAVADMGKTIQSLVKAAQDNGIRLN